MDPRSKVPPLAKNLLTLLVKEELVEEVLGDLDEKYEQQVEVRGNRRATLNYWYQVFQYIRPFSIKKIRIKNSNFNLMFTYDLKMAWRTMLKHKTSSIIKVGGFAIGIAAFILITLFVRDEMSYDRFYQNQDRIYRLIAVYHDSDGPDRWTAFPAQISEVLRLHFPEVEKTGRLVPYDWYRAGSNQLRKSDQKTNYYEEGFAYADHDLLEILEIPMVHGSRESALLEPNSIVISRRKAEKYFPGQDPVGQTLILNDDPTQPVVIGGVMENFPSYSHLQFDFLITLSGVEFWSGEQTSWCCWNYNPYLTLKPGASKKDLEEKLLLISDDYVVKYMEEQQDPDVGNAKKNFAFELQPVGDIHLHSEGIYDNFKHGNVKIVILFVAIAIFILLLACVNFINLSTAKSANRAKEVGLKKVVGAIRPNLIGQFLTESVMYSLVSVLIALILVFVLLPYFNSMADKDLSVPFEIWWIYPAATLFILVLGVMAGTYPSFFLSSFRPIDVLRGKLSLGSKSSRLRSALVIFQFTTSIVLIICAFVVYQQMEFILNKDLGFDKDQVIMIHGTNTLDEKLKPFKDELINLSEVKQAAWSSFYPVTGTKRDQNAFWLEDRKTLDVGVGAQRWRVDKDYLQTMGMELVAGRNFTDQAMDSSAILINETMARKLGLDDPIGKRIENWQPWYIIGVVKDFHFQPMKDEIGPLSLVRSERGSILAVKVSTANLQRTLSDITATWEAFMPNQPIRYNFLDGSFARMYDHVSRTGNVFTGFAVFAMLVACLGLFGLSSFMIEQRSKEISIRKVLGASVAIIFRLLTFNFLTLIGIALVIAVPFGWYLMRNWLDGFRYRIEMGWQVYVLAGLVVLVIALVTVSFESIRASTANPARGLRSE